VTRSYPALLGLNGWQWVYIAWGIPAVVLGVIVLLFLTDRPAKARWLDPEEREALETELERERAEHKASRHMSWAAALKQPRVLWLAAAYFFIVTGNYGVEFFLPSILKQWYNMPLDRLTSLLILPPIGSLVGQILVGWNSDRVHERRLHAVLPIYFGAAALAIVALLGHPPVWLTVTLFVLAMTGLKAYLPAFWSLPSLFLTEAAAAGSIGLINSVGNLGGFLGPNLMGRLEQSTGSFNNGLLILSVSMAISASLIMVLGLGKRVVVEKAVESKV
jgi:MFS transporter, ACS family, tartrate transporter